MVVKGLAAQARLDPEALGSIAAKLAAAEAELAELKTKLDEPMLKHQQELAARRDWDSEWASAVGSREDEESFRGLWARMRSYPAREAELATLKSRRIKTSRGILESLHQKADVLKELFAPVQSLVDEEPEIKEALGVSFSVRFSFDAFATLLFGYIKQSTGSFAGLEESKALAARLLAGHELTTGDGLDGFLSDVDEALTHDVRSNAKRPIKTASLLRSERSLADLYNFVFGLEYADLSYALLLGNVELERLSPGQRGALLLIFYFLVDRDRIPIVLDQPEENLDNETVYKLLVRVITRAKQHRQVIMATHNANLAVACDAEQVIVCTMDRDGTNRIRYLTGAIEELDLNQAIVDILEGTHPAFENRRRKYKRAGDVGVVVV